jgi:hypothetical protein
MNRLELRTAIRSVLREPTTARWPDPDINSYINNALEEVSRALLRRKTATSAVLANAETVTLPTDCLILTDLFWVGDNTTEIVREFDEEVPMNSDTGLPDTYWLIDDVIYLRPIPNAGGTVKFKYYYSLPSLDTDEATPSLNGLDAFIKAHGIYKALKDDSDPRFELWDTERQKELLAFLGVESSKYSTGFKVKERF